MSGKPSRSKGKRGETAAKKVLIEQGYEVHQNRAGEDGEDFAAYKDGKRFSVEVKNVRSLTHSMCIQTKRNAGDHDRLLMWHPSAWGMPGNLWVVFIWKKGEPARVTSWHGNTGRTPSVLDTEQVFAYNERCKE